jgi:pantetheine-phosphate adenylyltransferase
MSASHTARLGLLADLHLTPDTADEIATQVRNAIQHFESSNVDRIVVLGDLILEADTTADTNARLEQVFDLFEKTDLPVTHLLGNHDVVETDWQDVLDFTGIDPRHGAFPLTDDITGISLDTSAPEYPDARGKLSEAELEYLDQELEAAEYAVVFTHHPLYYHDLSDDGHFDEHPEAAFASDKYLANELFAEHGNVIAAVNGHTHLSDHTIYQGVPYFTINAMNEESPGNLEPNGSFAVLEVSRSRLKRLSHRHGTFDSAETIDYPADDQTVALGGTFGPIHDGHRQMFQRAFELGDVMVGLTSDELSSKTRHTDRPVPSFEERKATLQQELDELAEMYDREYTTRELTDPMGPVADDPTYTHLIVSPETFSRGETVNEKRLENGLEPMTLEVVEPLLADDGQRISSTRIVNGEIDEHGNVLDD